MIFFYPQSNTFWVIPNEINLFDAHYKNLVSFGLLVLMGRGGPCNEFSCGIYSYLSCVFAVFFAAF